ncbi:MAG: hypothetical protein ACFFAS_07235 [Promethearchaeota archaeon]
MNLEEQREIFNIFHDGTIINVERQDSDILLKIDIEYIAQILNETYKFFYLKLINCRFFKFVDWDDNEIIDNLVMISEMEPEILSCDVVLDGVKIFCILSMVSGGAIHFEAEHIKIYDHAKIEISLDKLVSSCEEYWNNSNL